MFSKVVDEGWEKDVEGKSFEIVDLLGLVLREGILPQFFLSVFASVKAWGEWGGGEGLGPLI